MNDPNSFEHPDGFEMSFIQSVLLLHSRAIVNFDKFLVKEDNKITFSEFVEKFANTVTKELLEFSKLSAHM